MSGTFIPGLTLVPRDDTDRGINILTFTGSIEFPETVRYGNSRPQEEFEKLDDIYDGTFGKFYKCKDRINRKVYALKKFIFPKKLKDGIPIDFLQEVSILDLIKHDNVVNSHAPVVGKKFESNFLLLDYCITSLQNLIEKKCDAIYESDVVKYMMKQMLDGINFIHECTVVHRNISCGSILFTESLLLKIGGFRNATFYSKENMTPVESDLIYKAPELLFEAKTHGYPVDMWAIGCIFANLLLKRPLFTGDSELKVVKSICTTLGNPNADIWPGFEKLLKVGSIHEMELSEKRLYTDLNNIFTGVPAVSCQLVEDLLIYYPDVRLTSSQMLTHTYFERTPETYSSKAKTSILQTVFSNPVSEEMSTDQ